MKSSWVPNLAKCMHGMCENNERYDYKTTRWIQKKNAMHVNPKHKWCVKKIFGQKLKNWKFFNFDQSSINRALIKSGRIKPKILSQFRSVKNQRRSIKNLEKWIFEKQSKLMQKLLKAHCIMNKMHEYELKSFSKTLEFNPDLPKQVFQSNCPKKSNIKHILHQIKEHIILNGHNKITHNIMYQV